MERTRKIKEEWERPVEFLFFIISMSVGLGNIWRFPFTVYENGGGAFLIPYIVVLTFVGRPLYFMELCLGQFSSSENVQIWEISPAFRGVGFAQCFSAWCGVTYYMSVLATSLYYFFASFSSVLPWSMCPENTTRCVDSYTNLSSTLRLNDTISSAEIYYQEEVLNVHSRGLEDGLFAPEWKLTLCLLLSWIVVYLILINGIKSSGKSVYFLTIFPYLIIFTLLIRGATLPGAVDGIIHFLYPDWKKVLDPKVWYSATAQCFFSLGTGFGQLVLLASHNNFRRNIYRDALIVTVTDTLTSLIAGCAIFSALGHLATILDAEVHEVIKGGGSSIAFISYPDMLARFNVAPQFFSVLFFSMLFTIGLGSITAVMLGLEEVVINCMPNLNKKYVRAFLHLLGFLLGLFYVTPQGQYILVLVDFYGPSSILIIMSFLQIFAVMWIYGYSKFSNDVEFMLGIKLGLYWKLCWKFLTPLILFSVFIGYLTLLEPLKIGNYVFGSIANAFGLSLVFVAVSFVPICFALSVMKNLKDSGWFESIKKSFNATELWAPEDINIKIEYDKFSKD